MAVQKEVKKAFMLWREENKKRKCKVLEVTRPQKDSDSINKGLVSKASYALESWKSRDKVSSSKT